MRPPPRHCDQEAGHHRLAARYHHITRVVHHGTRNNYELVVRCRSLVMHSDILMEHAPKSSYLPWVGREARGKVGTRDGHHERHAKVCSWWPKVELWGAVAAHLDTPEAHYTLRMLDQRSAGAMRISVRAKGLCHGSCITWKWEAQEGASHWSYPQASKGHPPKGSHRLRETRGPAPAIRSR